MKSPKIIIILITLLLFIVYSFYEVLFLKNTGPFLIIFVVVSTIILILALAKVLFQKFFPESKLVKFIEKLLGDISDVFRGL